MEKLSGKELLDKYESEYSDWFNVLKKYHENRFTTNYQQYTAWAQTEGTEAKISDPVAPEIIERIVKREFERDPKFFALARGKNIPKEVADIMGGVASFYWTNPDMVQHSGTARSRCKVLGRELGILGNAGTESYYNAKTNSPDFRVIPLEDIIFDPTKTLKTSPVYYIRNFVSLDYLKENAEITKEGKKYGYFKNIDKLKELLGEESKDPKHVRTDNSENVINRSGSDLYDKSVDRIELITRWKGPDCCRFIINLGDKDEKLMIYEFTNEVLEEDPLDFVMDIEVPKQPYAFGVLDSLNGLIKTKDLILNQTVDYFSKLLNPPLFVDLNTGIVNKASLVNAWKIGGLVFAPSSSAEHKPMPPLGSVGFDMLGYIQQRAESVTDAGAYLGGTPNQASDKTAGTATGIQSLIQQAQPTVKDRQQNIEESIIEPIINKWLKMAAALMSENEIKYVLISGQSPKWVRVTKGLLSGKIMLTDLLEAELVDEMEAQEIMAMMAENGQDPNKELVFDVDWLLRVETGSMAEVDKEKDLQNFDGTIQAGQAMGIPLDMQKVWVERAIRAGIKEPEQYIMQQNGMPMGPQQPLMIGSIPVEGAMQGPNGEIMNGGTNGPRTAGGIGAPSQTPQGLGGIEGVPSMAG